MYYFKFLALSILLCSLGCEQSDNSSESTATMKTMYFKDFVDLQGLEKVEMSNNSGSFILTDAQKAKLVKELTGMEFDPNISVKVGAIAIDLTIQGKTYRTTTATKGAYLEVPEGLITKNKNALRTSKWLYFKTKGVNFDNYKRTH